ncbi:MAG: DUF1542 domain-containing protein [Vagococcus sp.]
MLEETISNIEKDSNLSDAAKTEQKEKAKSAYNDGIEAIGNATDADGLNTAVSDGKTAIEDSYKKGTPLNEQQEKAKDNLSEVARLTKEKIDADANLSDADKTAQKAAVDSALEEGNAAIDVATSGELLSQAITSGTKAIEDSYVKGIPLDEQKATAKENLQNIAKETKANIDKDETLSADEKEKQKANVDKALEAGELAIGEADTPDELITEVATGTKNIKESHVKGSSLEDQKKEADKALDDKVTEVKNAIDEDPSLTAKEKEEQKAAVDKAAEDAKKVIEDAKTPEAIAKATEDGKIAIGKEHETGTPVDKQKEEAGQALEEAANKEKAAIDEDPTLTDKEKTDQKANVDKAVEEAKTAIEEATTPEAIAKAKEDGTTTIGEKHVPGTPVDKQKEKAEQVITEAAAKEKAAIDEDPTLTDKEKETQKEAVDKAVEDAKKAIETATTPEAINDARDKGVEVIGEKHQSGESVDNQKEVAKAEIDTKATAVKESIAKDPTLTEAEKTKQQELVDAEADKAKGLIDEATKASEINSAKDNGLAAIEGAHKPGQGLDARKESANKALEEEAKVIKERINADITLTEEEKQNQSNGVDKALEDAKQAVSKAKDASSVDTAKGEGITAIDGNYQPGSSLEIRKEAAKTSLDKEAEATKAEIANDPTLTTEQKELQSKAVDEVTAKAKEAIDNATDASGVDLAKGKGVETIGNQHQPGDGLDARKDSAKEALEKEAILIKERIAKDTTLTVEEKAEQSAGVDSSLAQAIDAVDAATDANGIDAAKGDGIEAIDGNYQPGSSLVERKQSAKDALIEEANEIKDLIANDPTLTADEKVAQSAAVDTALNNGLTAIDNAPDASGVDNAKGDGITNIDGVYQPGDGLNLRKDSAKEALEKEAAKIREAIESDSTLTGEEKANQISGVNSSLETALGAVDAAQNADGVDAAKGEGITAIDGNYQPGTPILERKDNAKNEIDEDAERVKERINNDASLTDEEKAVQSAAVDTAAENAKAAIDAATDASGVDSARGQGVTDINGSYQPGEMNLEERKAAAKADIDDAESDAINRINSDPTLTAEEKANQVAGVTSAAENARGAIDGATDASGVDRAQGQGITAIDNNYKPGIPLDSRKDAAKAGIEEERLVIIDKINNDSTLTEEEKATQIAGANAAADNALAAIDGATDASGVDTAKGQGITAIDNNYKPGSPLDSRKELAKEGIDEAAEELKERILNDVTLTDEEKATQIAGANEDADKAKAAIDAATDASGVDNAKGRGITEIDDNYQPGNPLDGRKELAKEGIDTAAKEAIDKIKNDPTLTTKEKETQIAGVNEDAAKAKEAIDGATNASGVDAAKGDGIEEVDNNYQPGNPLDGRKEDAKNDIDRFTEEAIDRITNDPTLTKEEKEKQIAGVNEDADKAKAAIDAATDASGVDAAKGEGVTEIDDNHQSGNPLDSRKELAKEAIDKAATDAKDKIANDPTLTKEEKAKQSEAVDASKDKAKETIDAATDASGVDNAKGQGITAIDGNYQPGNPLTDRKEAAKKDIDKEANATKEKINNDKTLTALEKETQIQEVDAEATKAKEAIDTATDASGVDNAKGQGITEINKKYQTGSGLETRKESAKADIDAAAKATKDKIVNDPSLTAAEKTEQSKSVDAAAKKAKEAIDAATNADGVDVAKGQGITNIDQAYQPGAPVEGVKETAKNEIDAAAEATKDKINKDATLTSAEKAEQSKAVDAEAKKAKDAIDAAKDVDAIKETRDKGVSSVNEQHETGKALDSQKEAANKAIEEAAAKEKADIAKDASLSKEEKAKQTAAVDAEVKAAKEAISKAENADAINVARDKGVSSIDEQHKAGTSLESQKEAANKAIDEAAAKEKADIAKDASLSKEEKAKQTAAVDAEVKAAKEAISKAESADAINAARDKGVSSIDEQHKAGTSLESQKEAANKAIDEAAAKEKADIAKDASLSKEEKAKQTAAVDAEVKAAKEAISKAESADAINAARDKGVSSINEQHKVGTPLESQKEAAKKELEAIAEATKDKINNDTKLTAKEKEVQIKAVEEALKAAEKLINKAEDADAINKAKKEAVTTIEAQYKPGKKTTGGTGNNGGGSYTGGKGGTYTGGSNTSGTTGKGGSLPKTGSEATSGLFAGIVGLGLSGLAFLGFRRKEDEVEK